ncbi:MAG: 3-deoxy-D-manno-octulosonic acid transferase, partial [Gammaproteobacteria bacterium]|nr:3-deoxy-D-manno-octulosonic acid transferase [Gammaproteobacteria bacterium]
AHGYIPLDLPGACRRLLNRLSPRLMVVMETEIWPNLFHRAAEYGTPVLMVNAQISSRSLVSYRRFARVTAAALASVSRVLAASEEDARRFVDCGADAARVTVAGNIKFDLSLSPDVVERGHELRAAWGAGRKVIVAGSTHEADEAALFEAFTKVLESSPDTLLVLAPRHPERFDAAAAAAGRCGFSVSRHSLSAVPGPSCQCFLLDTMGTLQAAYGAADVAFIGGSFSDIGGHNPLEAALVSVPVLTGPDMSGQADIHHALVAGGAARQVQDAAELASAMAELLGDESLRRQMGAAGAAAIAQNRGVTERALAHASEILDRVPGNPETAP